MFQFGGPGEQFDYNSSSSFWCLPNDIENGGFGGEESQSASSVDQNPFADGDQMLSWSGSATPSDNLFFPCDSIPCLSNTSTGAEVLRVGNSQDTYFDINQDVTVPLFGGGETKDVDMDINMEDASSSEMEPSADLSQEDPGPFDPHITCRESTQSRSVRSFFVPVSLPQVPNADPPPPTKAGTCRLDLSSNTGDCCASAT